MAELETLFERFIDKFKIGENEEFKFSNDEHKYKICNGELMIYCYEQNKWLHAGENTKQRVADKILLAETRTRKLFGGA